MGNEGSVPQETEELDEQLEYQAKAPPSATNPPGVTPSHSHSPSSLSLPLSNGLSTLQHQQQSQQQHQSGVGVGGSTSTGGVAGNNGVAGKGRLMGSVFTRRGNAHNQNSTGIFERTTMEVAASYPPTTNSKSPAAAISSSMDPSLLDPLTPSPSC
jgi:hypothetical protein